jgi:hypothetical protein
MCIFACPLEVDELQAKITFLKSKKVSDHNVGKILVLEAKKEQAQKCATGAFEKGVKLTDRQKVLSAKATEASRRKHDQ